MNGLPIQYDAIVTGDMFPDCRGKYILTGTYNDYNYYRRADGAFYIWHSPIEPNWQITTDLGDFTVYVWRHRIDVTGTYEPIINTFGEPVVKLERRPPPTDYQIPKL